MNQKPRPLAWLPAVAKTLTRAQRLELMQVLDFAWAHAYDELTPGCAYAPVEFGDIEVAHRDCQVLTIPKRKAKPRKAA